MGCPSAKLYEIFEGQYLASILNPQSSFSCVVTQVHIFLFGFNPKAILKEPGGLHTEMVTFGLGTVE